MKKLIALAAALIILTALCSCGSEPASGTPAASVTAAPPLPSVISTATGTLKDGTYQYNGKNDGEEYHVEGTMIVSNGNIQSMEWKIIDSAGRVFDEAYEEVFKGNDVYIQQSRDNWSGLQTYVPALLDTQDPDKVDAVSGATWAYNKFEEAAKALLEQAGNKKVVPARN